MKFKRPKNAQILSQKYLNIMRKYWHYFQVAIRFYNLLLRKFLEIIVKWLTQMTGVTG
ncbi:hypothetical protein [Helicobacter jaachi]|uniref:hypothetical protein n=1 Tax=Helicobacter jaachi TaxID=1677920 RepID=UPI001883475B|nr:hypothetical protein [Helicobacter jaachi]